MDDLVMESIREVKENRNKENVSPNLEMEMITKQISIEEEKHTSEVEKGKQEMNVRKLISYKDNY